MASPNPCCITVLAGRRGRSGEVVGCPMCGKRWRWDLGWWDMEAEQSDTANTDASALGSGEGQS